jgi:hypothetical protein
MLLSAAVERGSYGSILLGKHRPQIQEHAAFLDPGIRNPA